MQNSFFPQDLSQNRYRTWAYSLLHLVKCDAESALLTMPLAKGRSKMARVRPLEDRIRETREKLRDLEDQKRLRDLKQRMNARKKPRRRN